jgi:hypothetical protein
MIVHTVPRAPRRRVSLMRSTSPRPTSAVRAALLVLMFACGTDKPAEDAGVVPDAGAPVVKDAAQRDAASTRDAGNERDAGDPRDAGRPHDGGHARDAGDSKQNDDDAGADAAVALAANGTICTSGSACATGFCVDGVCCDLACQGACEACSKAKTGQPNGQCRPAPVDTDPDGDCSGLLCRTGVCDGARACQVSTDGTLCRPAVGACDSPETCAQGVCPTDTLIANGEICRAAAADCDVAESCDGSSGVCPDDAFLASSVVCRAASGACDAAELCPGDSALCPVDLMQPQGFECRATEGVCDRAERCTGSGPDCPTDVVQPEGTLCRPAEGVCDRAEYCGGGTYKTCGADAKSTSVCRPAAGTCDIAESCNGLSDTCPTDVFRTSGAAVCGGMFCSGQGAACVECRDSNDCVGGEVCSTANACITVKRVFASSSTHTGNLGGLAGADGICQSLADAEGLSGTFKAWLSSSTVTASSRLTHATIPYYLPNNTKIADDWSDLVDGTIDNPLNANEAGTTLPSFLPWTGATHTGGIATYQCSDWTSSANAQFGSNGSSTRTDLAWTLNNTRRCDTVTRVFCFQQ